MNSEAAKARNATISVTLNLVTGVSSLTLKLSHTGMQSAKYLDENKVNSCGLQHGARRLRMDYPVGSSSSDYLHRAENSSKKPEASTCTYPTAYHNNQRKRDNP
jgi:spore coat polysaccharide biosynthesis predicted glycosyltransferase SpsG